MSKELYPAVIVSVLMLCAWLIGRSISRHHQAVRASRTLSISEAHRQESLRAILYFLLLAGYGYIMFSVRPNWEWGSHLWVIGTSTLLVLIAACLPSKPALTKVASMAPGAPRVIKSRALERLGVQKPPPLDPHANPSNFGTL